jgi:hypothetical protein
VSSAGTTGASGGATGSQPVSARTPQEKQGALEGQLDESLRKFDEMLLKEQQVLAERREESGDSPQGGGGSMGGGSRGSVSSSGRSGEEDRASAGARSTGDGDEGSAASGDYTEGGTPQTGSSEGGVTSSSRGAPTPAGIPDGGDDDIVARQLREAAQAEKDPALRKKLWEEYCTYKKSTSGKRCTSGWARSPESGESQ